MAGEGGGGVTEPGFLNIPSVSVPVPSLLCWISWRNCRCPNFLRPLATALCNAPLQRLQFTLAGMLTFFLLCSIAFEKVKKTHRPALHPLQALPPAPTCERQPPCTPAQSTRWLVAHLKKRKRNGLAQAVENLVTELTLVGFIALLLTVLQSPISHICVSYTPSTYSYWNLLRFDCLPQARLCASGAPARICTLARHATGAASPSPPPPSRPAPALPRSNVEGCDCCLAHTASVASCFQAQRECGPGYCNCEGEDPACLASAADSLGDLLAEWEADPACGAQSACGADFLERAQESPEAVAALEKGPGLECEGEVALDTKQCGPGSAPLISITAQHQLHIFLFVVRGSGVGGRVLGRRGDGGKPAAGWCCLLPW